MLTNDSSDARDSPSGIYYRSNPGSLGIAAFIRAGEGNETSDKVRWNATERERKRERRGWRKPVLRGIPNTGV